MSKTAFFDAVRPMFGGKFNQDQVDGLNILVGATSGLPISYRAYLLATAYHETGRTMLPIREAFGSTDAQSIARLESSWSKGRMKSVKTPYWRRDADGKSWFGRGYVQLTHKYNYERASKLTGVDLVSDPSKAMIPAIAAKILVDGSVDGMFTGKSLGTYLKGSRPDYFGARRVINGNDKASAIAGYAKAFEAAFRAMGDDTPSNHEPTPEPDPVVPEKPTQAPEPVPAPEPAPAPTPDPAQDPQSETKTVWGALVALMAAIFGRS